MDNTAVMAEAGRLVELASARAEAGDMEGTVAAYRDLLALVPNFAGAWNNLAMALDRLGHGDEAVEAYRRAVALAPDYAMAWSNLGVLLRRRGRLSEAVEVLRRAAALQPDYADALSNLGAALQETGNAAEAAEICLRAAALRPDLPEGWSNLATALIELGRFADAEESCRRALAVRPDYPEAARNLGLALRLQGRLDEAGAAFRRAVELRPDFADAWFDLAILHLLRGDFAEGWRLYEWRWKTGQVPPPDTGRPRWQGEDGAARTLLVLAEQGLGDTLHFARLVPRLRGRFARVVFAVPPPLLRLMAGLADEVVPLGGELPSHDLMVPLLSLPGLLGVTLDTIPAEVPYLAAAPDRVEAWRQRLGPPDGRLRVGLVWAGNPRPNDPAACRVDRRRSLHLSQLAPLAAIGGVRFVSLQKDPPAALQAASPPAGMDLLTPMAEVTDFAHTAALVSLLDLVICVDTSIAHLAGALGRPVWVLSRFDGCWRWLLDRDDSPWYPTARLYRQRRPGDWAEVVARVAADLHALAPAGLARLDEARHAHRAGRWDQAEGLYRQAVAALPGDALARAGFSALLYGRGRRDEALALLREAVRLAPDVAELRNTLGVMLAEAGEMDMAAMELEAAIRLRPDYAEAWDNRGALHLRTHALAEAEACCRRALSLNPGLVSAHDHLGGILLQGGDAAGAADSFRHAVAHAPGHVEAHIHLGLALLTLGDLPAGFAEYEWRLRRSDLDARGRADRQWRGQDLTGKTLLLYAEQGFGDVFQFIRFVPALAARGARVVVEAPAPLHHLLRGVPGLAALVATGAEFGFDYHLPLMSVPGVLGTTVETIPATVPYLSAEAARTESWRIRLGGEGFRVGIVWQGNPQYGADGGRSLPLRSFAPLAAIPGVQLVSLQWRDGLDQLEHLPAGMTVLAPGPDFNAGPDAFADTAAVIAGLDLVVTVDTAAAHLAGALARPVWILLPKGADWRWLQGREDSPWYPTARLYRQQVPGDWEAVMAQAAADLTQWLAEGSSLQGGLELLRAGDPVRAERRIRLFLATSPNYLPALCSLGLALRLQGRDAAAVECWRRALPLAPGDAELRNNLGNALARLGRLTEAEAAYRDGLAQAPDLPELLNGLGDVLRRQGRLAEAEARLRQALSLCPEYAEAWNSLALIPFYQGEQETALACCREAIRIRPDYAEARFHLGLALLRQGDWAEGWAEYEWRLRLPGFLPPGPPIPAWSGESLAGRTILLRAEQGWGDLLQFARFVPVLAAQGARVVLEAPPPLHRLLKTLPGLAAVVAPGAAVAADLQVPLMSVPHLLGLTPDTLPAPVPYLSAEPDLAAAWRLRLGDQGVRVGVVWQGNPGYVADAARSIPLAALAPLAAVPGVRLVSLQVRDGLEQLEQAPMPVDRLGADFAAGPDALVDSAAVVAGLDLVVCVDTAAAHLAGALGVPVWILLPKGSDWRWLLGRDDTPWYPAARLFRQARLGDWGEVVGRVAAALRGLMAKRLFVTGVARYRAGCPAEAEAFYKAALDLEPGHAAAEACLGVVLSQQGRLEEAAAAYRRALPNAPGDAELRNNLGNVLVALGRPAEAVEIYREAVALAPAVPQVGNGLGNALRLLDRMDEARAVLEEVTARVPDYAEAHNTLGNLWFDLRELERAEACWREALRLDPGSAVAHGNLGLVRMEHGDMAAAEARFRTAVALNPGAVDAHFTLGLALLKQGKWAEGWAEYEWRRRKPGFPALGADIPEWRGEPLGGRTILLYGEQGFGDSLQFARYVPLVARRGGRVVVAVQAPLVRLMRTLEGVAEVVEFGGAAHGVDCHAPLMSLPMILGTTEETIPRSMPYLFADPAAAARWAERLGDDGRLRVGLVWSGAPRKGERENTMIDRRRSMKLADFAPLAEVPGLRLVSLQKGEAAAEPRPPGLDLWDVTAELGDFADTAALVMALDLVISVDTAMAHLAGALGRPVWVLSRFDGCWRWLRDRDDSPWYPCARLYRQATAGEWGDVIHRVKSHLSDMTRNFP